MEMSDQIKSQFHYKDGLEDAAKKCDELAAQAKELSSFDKGELSRCSAFLDAAKAIRQLIQS